MRNRRETYNGGIIVNLIEKLSQGNVLSRGQFAEVLAGRYGIGHGVAGPVFGGNLLLDVFRRVAVHGEVDSRVEMTQGEE